MWQVGRVKKSGLPLHKSCYLKYNMRRIKLSGREISLVRVIGFGIGASGKELLETTKYDLPELVDMLNGMMNTGFIVTDPYLLEITEELLHTTQFEINSAYVHEIRKALPVRF